MWLDPRRYEVMDDKIAEIMRAKSPDERLNIAHGMWRCARSLVYDGIRHQHPEWDEQRIM
jgi:hypothetical protein